MVDAPSLQKLKQLTSPWVITLIRNRSHLFLKLSHVGGLKLWISGSAREKPLLKGLTLFSFLSLCLEIALRLSRRHIAATWKLAQIASQFSHQRKTTPQRPLFLFISHCMAFFTASPCGNMKLAQIFPASTQCSSYSLSHITTLLVPLRFCFQVIIFG